MTHTKRLAAASVALIAAASLFFGGCKKYDDTAVWEKLNELETRLSVVEGLVGNLNSDVSAMRTIVNTLDKRLYVTGIVTINGGYKISFSDGSSYSLTGSNGGSGIDAPIIGVGADGGVYYWTQTVDGKTSWLLDETGNRVPVAGSSKPVLSVSGDGYWIVSYDGGAHFDYILDQNGQRIKASCDCVSFFQSVTYNNGILTFVLADGTTIPIEVHRDERIDSVVPEDLQAKISDYIPLYTGDNPPELDNAYIATPFIAVYCEDNGYAPGDQVYDMVMLFRNFDVKKKTLDYYSQSGTASSKAIGAYISGSGNYFTAFFNTTGESNGISTKTALVISGIVVDGGIKNLHYAFVLVDKGNDPNNVIMAKGVYRVFKDKDDFSEETEWTFGGIPPKPIDLGLPSGTCWANYNLGASTAEDYGDYYAWGEVTTKSTYYWSNYKWCNGAETSLTKYCTSSNYGKVDNARTLNLADDAAYAVLGDKWRVPTVNQFAELCNTSSCSWSWTSKNGVKGYEVKSKSNGASIFLPAAGVFFEKDVLKTGEYGYYWASSIENSAPSYAYILDSEIDGTISASRIALRYYGLPIRAVYK